MYKVGDRVYVPYVRQNGVIVEVLEFRSDNEVTYYIRFDQDPVMVWGEWFSGYEVEDERQDS